MKKTFDKERVRRDAARAQNIENPLVRAMVTQTYSHTDPNGSYTGKPEDPAELPQQDVDDL